MNVFITGATGFIGRQLVKSLLADGHNVTALTRSAAKAKNVLGERVKIVQGDPLVAGPWLDELAEHDAVVNLCGEPILKKKWTPERKRLLLDSRLIPTKLMVEAIGGSPRRPQVLVSGSAIGYYGGRGDELLTEESGPGRDFGAELCSRWEAEANRAADAGVRVVTLRTGFVLGRGGGGLAEMIKPFRFFAGGPIGRGRQYVSWIHINDHVGITKLALTNPAVSGPVNMTAPSAVTNREFARTLGRVLGRPSWLPLPVFALRLMFGREAAALMVEGQRVLPKKAQEAGYKWQFADVRAALTDVLKT